MNHEVIKLNVFGRLRAGSLASVSGYIHTASYSVTIVISAMMMLVENESG